jgi:hypothetical protein
MALTLSRLEGTRTHRLIASRFPTVGVFDYMPDAEAVAAALELEQATNGRLNDVLGRLALIQADAILGVPTAHQAMAAFLHVAETGGRFNGPELGAWYAALDLDTAFDETVYHHSRRLAASAGGFPNTIEMREFLSSPVADLIDLRPIDDPALYHRDDYSAGQTFGRRSRAEGRDGIWYRSVRRERGECVAILKPRLVVPITQAGHFRYDWDARGVASISRMTKIGASEGPA